MQLPIQAQPVARNVSTATFAGGVEASGLKCTLCCAACDQLSGLKKKLCELACHHVISGCSC